MKTESGNTIEVKALVQFDFRTDASIIGKIVHPMTVITDQHGDPWWVAKEVCKVLGLANVGQAVSALDDDEKLDIIISDFQSPGRGGDSGKRIIINEPGLYFLIGKSRKPAAKAFRRWVNHEVLPEIRKTGSYSAKLGLTPDDMRTMFHYLEKAVKLIQEKDQALAEAQPKVAYYDTYATCEGLFSLTEAAKHLGLNPHHFLAKLRYDKVLYKTGTASINSAFQQYIDDGCFVLNAPTTGRGYAWPQTLVTPKGLLFLIARYGRFGNRAAVMHPDDPHDVRLASQTGGHLAGYPPAHSPNQTEKFT